jgi:hypothetical protein
VLERDVAERTTRNGPKARVVLFAGFGHAPPLLNDEQIETVREFLVG